MPKNILYRNIKTDPFSPQEKSFQHYELVHCDWTEILLPIIVPKKMARIILGATQTNKSQEHIQKFKISSNFHDCKKYFTSI